VATSSRIEHLPVSFFAVVMGLTGFALAWEKAEAVHALPFRVHGLLTLLAAAVFVALLAAYGYKLATHRAAVVAELRHPVKLNFFPAISISLVLIATATLNTAPALSLALWSTGAALHLGFTFYVMGVWIHHQHFEITHINPAWFIPVVGNVLVPIAGTTHGFPEVSWFFFSIGLLFWLVLLSIIFYRVLFHQPLPEKLMPTFFILIAPPAVGFLAYAKLGGGIDAFARVLYYSSLFLTFLLLTQARRFMRLPFFLSWWAYSFPIAAITIGTLVMAAETGRAGFALLSWLFLVILTAVVGYLVYRTATAARQGAICQPDA
jgi:tellurite resistance protein